MTNQAPRWRKRGRLFDPTDYDLPADCTEFAQSPQALVCDGFVRIYFSSRRRDADSGKFLSHVLFVDLNWELQHVLRVAEQPVLSLGGLGCFDEHGIFPLSPIRVGDQVFAYTCGWSRRVGVSVETGIGLAISDDGGTTFKRHGDGPILSATLHEPCLVGDGFVRRFGDVFHMWYIFGLPWRQFAGQSEPDRIYKIAHATSPDGIQWKKTGGDQLIADAIGDDECQALPTVIESGGRFHMYFCYRYASDFRTNPERGYRIGYAFSDDLQQWTRDDDQVGIERSTSADAWDGQMMCYPHVFHHNQNTYLLYNGNEFGRRGFGIAVAEA
ncbi:hypothetical protein [Planctomycetes bacterium TBK1r]|uniref:Glycosyl hydrolases family 43 n=1 Tax=Stieleria magnilauensis TaxID=2527963 RepID=A0ABX5XVM7_9BACT|nr:hypothetical protein TBK1r_51030 [Planctomycetes bacterium TBK1r]